MCITPPERVTLQLHCVYSHECFHFVHAVFDKVFILDLVHNSLDGFFSRLVEISGKTVHLDCELSVFEVLAFDASEAVVVLEDVEFSVSLVDGGDKFHFSFSFLFIGSRLV